VAILFPLLVSFVDWVDGTGALGDHGHISYPVFTIISFVIGRAVWIAGISWGEPSAIGWLRIARGLERGCL
jgi:hypothetical protein